MRPQKSLRLRRALTRWESAMVSCTQSVLVNWSYQTRSSGKMEPLDSVRESPRSERADISLWPHEAWRLWWR